MSRWEDKVPIQNMRAFCFKLLWGWKEKNILKWEERILVGSMIWCVYIWLHLMCSKWASRWHSGKEATCQCRRFRRLGFDPWAGKIPWRGNGSQLQYSGLGNPMDRGAWWVTVQWMAEELDLTEWLSKHARCIQNTLVSYAPINTTWWV